MNAPYLRSVLALTFLAAASCDEKSSHQAQPPKPGLESPSAAKPGATGSDESHHHPTEGVKKRAEDPYVTGFETLKGALSLERTKTTDPKILSQERRDIIKSIANAKGVPENDVLAAFFARNPQADAWPSILGRCYLDSPEIAVKSYLKGLEGGGRTTALISYASSLSRNGDVSGIGKMYDLIPPGKDRASISSKLVLTSARTEGVEAALERLVAFDVPEEKRTALLGLCANIGSLPDPPSEDDLNRVYAVAKELGNESAARSAIAIAIEMQSESK